MEGRFGALIVGSIIAILLQIMVAPYIAVGDAVPNFIVAYTVAVAIVRRSSFGCIFPFIMGLTSDLLGGGPLGSMAFLLVCVTFAASRAYMVLENDTLFMPLALIIISMFAVEFLYGVMMVISTGVSVADAFVYRSLPCALYDCVLGLIAYPFAARFVADPQRQTSAVPLN